MLSGSPFSVNQENAPEIDLKSILGNKPVIAICYGAQLIAKTLNGKVENSNSREYGRANLSFIEKDCKLFNNIKINNCLLYTSPSPRDKRQSRMPSSA